MHLYASWIEVLWTVTFVIALLINIWAFLDARVDLEYQKQRTWNTEEEHRHILARCILAKGEMLQETLRIVTSSAFLYAGVASMFVPANESSREYLGIWGDLIVPAFIIAGVCLAIKSIAQRTTRLLAVNAVLYGEHGVFSAMNAKFQILALFRNKGHKGERHESR